MRGLLVAVARAAVLVVLLAAMPAGADTFADTWLRGASSVAVNDDATALFINPAGLGMYQGSNWYTSVSMAGKDVVGVSAISKLGPIGLGYNRQHLWKPGADAEEGLRPADNAVDTYYAGLALGDPRSFSVGFDYRWFRPQFGDRKKTGTWDIGAMYRPSSLLSFGVAVRNMSEPDVLGDDGCGCGTTTTYVAGVAVRPMGSKLTLMADASAERDQDFEDAVFTAGVEAEVADGLVLRGSLMSYPDGDDRASEFSAGLWFNMRNLGVGGDYRSFEAAEHDILTYGFSTSDERQRTIFRGSGQVAEIDIEGPLSDFRRGWSLFGEPDHSAQAIIRDIGRAGRDESVGCILLNIKSLGGTFLGGPSALVQEVRDEVVRVRRDYGVKVLAFCEYGAGTQEVLPCDGRRRDHGAPGHRHRGAGHLRDDQPLHRHGQEDRRRVGLRLGREVQEHIPLSERSSPDGRAALGGRGARGRDLRRTDRGRDGRAPALPGGSRGRMRRQDTHPREGHGPRPH